MVLVFLIDGFFEAHRISAKVGLSVAGDFSNNSFPSVKLVVLAVSFRLYFNS